MIRATEIQRGKRQSKLLYYIFWFKDTRQLLHFTCFPVVRNLQLLFHRKLNLLSFGEEAEEEEKELAAVQMKIKSSHDVLNDPRLLKEEDSTSKPVLVNVYYGTFSIIIPNLCAWLSNCAVSRGSILF